MNKLIQTTAFLALLLCFTLTSYGQAKKPTLMVVPSDNWCVQNGYTTQFNNTQQVLTLPDYEKALQNSSDLLLVISKLNELMADRGFPMKNLESALKTLKTEMAEDAVLMSKDGSGEVAETPIDRLKKTAKADIILQLTYTVNTQGPKKSITFNLQGLDAYTDKQIAGASGTGEPSFSTVMPVLLEEAVLAYLDNFNNQLQTHFDDMFENGREITIRIKRFDSWEDDLESEFGGEELAFIIEDWMAANTVKGRFSISDQTENYMFFEQVRIPLYNTSGRAIDARGFARDLSKSLKDNQGITNKLMTRGLGGVTIVLGSK